MLDDGVPPWDLSHVAGGERFTFGPAYLALEAARLYHQNPLTFVPELAQAPAAARALILAHTRAAIALHARQSLA